MKKTILIAAIISGGIAYGQKGSWYIGGGAGFSTGSTKSGSLTTRSYFGSLSPEIGKFITDRIQLGAGLTAEGNKIIPPIGTSSESLSLGGKLYGRYLFGDSPFKPFLGASTYHTYGQSKTSGYPDKMNISRFGIHLNAGFAYTMSPRIAVFGSVGVVGFNHEKHTIAGETDQIYNNFGANFNTLGNRFTIGMYYTFREGK